MLFLAIGLFDSIYLAYHHYKVNILKPQTASFCVINETIDCDRVAGAPASLECRVTQIVALKGEGNFLVIGEVSGVHMRDDCIRDGRFDVTVFQPLARLGYKDYARITEIFSLARPDD